MESNETEGERWTVTVDEEGLLILPDELWNQMDWKDGDNLEWIDQEDGSFLLVKVEEPLNEAETANPE